MLNYFRKRVLKMIAILTKLRNFTDFKLLSK